LLDSELLAEVYLELRGGRQAALLLKQEQTEAEQQEAEIAFVGHTDMPTRTFPPSAEELAAHKVMLEKIKNPIWSAA
jgi:DNA polymerase-3 subunit epsilon